MAIPDGQAWALVRHGVILTGVAPLQQATGRLAVDGIVGPTTLRELGLLR